MSETTAWMNKLSLVLFLFTSLSGVAFGTEERDVTRAEADLSRKLETIENFLEHTFPMNESRLIQIYDKDFPNGVALAAAETANQDLLIRAANVVNDMGFYTHQTRFATELRHLIEPIHVSGEPHEIWLKRLFGLYVASRNFQLAKTLAEEFNEISFPPLPNLTATDAAIDTTTVLKLEDEGTVLRRVPVDIRKGVWVVVLVQPHCGFSKQAVDEISADTKLIDRLTGRSLWLMPQEGSLNVGLVREWFQRYPWLPLAYLFRKEEWPELDASYVPQFYFFKDGVLVQHWQNWPEHGGNRLLEKLLMELDLGG